MKNFLFFLTLALTFFTSCTNDDESDNKRNHALLDMMQTTYVAKYHEYEIFLSETDIDKYESNIKLYISPSSFIDEKSYGKYGNYIFYPNGTFNEGDNGLWKFADNNTTIQLEWLDSNNTVDEITKLDIIKYGTNYVILRDKYFDNSYNMFICEYYWLYPY